MTTGPERPQAVSDSVLAPALELAWLVAKMSSEARPPAPVPSALRPLLRFTKLNGRALATLRRVLDDDEEFRARVAVTVTDEVGAAAALFLQRPEGWEEELAALSADREAAVARGQEDRAERDATRRLAGAEAARRRSDAALAEARAALERSTAEIAIERQQRRQAEERASRSDRRAESLAAERDRARRRADDAAEEAADLRAAVTRLRTELTERDSVPDLVRVSVAKVEAAIEAARVALVEMVSALEAAPVVPPSKVSRRARPAPKRTPLALPPGVLDDSVEAAEHLVRTGGVRVFVDGYNATLSVWTGIPLAEQRARLLDAVSELAARSGAEVLVVFDGAEEPGLVPEGRRLVMWRFSPPGVEADDVILELVEATPLNVPVVVASSDRRVQEGARTRGANVITTTQLFGVLRREAG